MDEFEHIQDIDGSVKVYVSTYNGDRKLHIRYFADTQRYAGPTKKGVQFSLSNKTALIRLVAAIRQVYLHATGEQLP